MKLKSILAVAACLAVGTYLTAYAGESRGRGSSNGNSNGSNGRGHSDAAGSATGPGFSSHGNPGDIGSTASNGASGPLFGPDNNPGQSGSSFGHSKADEHANGASKKEEDFTAEPADEENTADEEDHAESGGKPHTQADESPSPTATPTPSPRLKHGSNKLAAHAHAPGLNKLEAPGNSAFGHLQGDPATRTTGSINNQYGQAQAGKLELALTPPRGRPKAFRLDPPGNSAFGHLQGDPATRTIGSVNNAYGQAQAGKLQISVTPTPTPIATPTVTPTITPTPTP